MLDRTAPPPFRPAHSFSLIPLQSRTLLNGARIHAINGGAQDVLKVEFIYPAGRWFEERIGESYFASSLLNKGIPGKNSFEIASELDFYGAHVQIQPGFDFVSVSIHVLKSKFIPLLEILFAILERPTFPEEELDQAKQLYLENLRVNNEKSGYIASRALRAQLYGNHSAYGNEIEQEHVETINRSNLEAYFHRYFIVPDIFVSGKVEEEIITRLDKLAGKMSGGTPRQRFDSSVSPAPATLHIPREKSVQSTLRLGRLIPNRESQDYFRLLFLNHILGGYFGSRLMKSLREELGLTYGIHSSIHSFLHSSFMVIGTDVNRESRNAAIAEIWKEMDRLTKEPVPTGEFETARNHFIGSFLTELSTAFDHAEKHKSILLYGLAGDYYQQMIRVVSLFTPGHMQETATTYFTRESFVEVSVG